ncbi:primosomal protein DnaI [Fructobacillus sp. M1-13]|uniref:Primosomal protein DnaI n=1 Tax=Fructobacillus papyriferae TaxID=2713171 RepID=A0ABS5QPD9_9LACO|nr:primosomal protein DnaI [Fructobacillus papyriferae]MBS9335043.1 primosomal protein DnaI [Fructobacillus papyriferae]MCD2159471.1 primosomal protein DnaI [Fructobacillus papyriferae]
MQDLATVLKDFQKRFPALTESRAADAFEAIQQDEEVKAFFNDNQAALKPDALVVSITDLFEFVREKKRVKEGKQALYPGYHPRLVLEKGYPHVAYEPSEDTKKALRQAALLKSVAVPKSVAKADLNQIVSEVQDDEGRAPAVAAVVATFSALVNKENQRGTNDDFVPGVYLSGDFGIGKTYLMGALANALAYNGIGVMMVHWSTMIERLKGSFGSNGDQSLLDMIDEAKKAPVLILDDLGADTLSSWSRDSVLAVILEYRMQHELTTCFTSNFDLDSLEKYLAQTRDGQEPGKAARLMQRVLFLSKPVAMAGKNRRLDR